MSIKIEWTQEKMEKTCSLLEKWIIKHNAWGGEKIMQDDDCQIYAAELISDIVDDVIKPISD